MMMKLFDSDAAREFFDLFLYIRIHEYIILSRYLCGRGLVARVAAFSLASATINSSSSASF